jgi:hypothetical protein
VGPPIDLGIYRADSFQPLTTGRLDASNAYYQRITDAWNTALQEAFVQLPSFRWPDRAHEPLELPSRPPPGKELDLALGDVSSRPPPGKELDLQLDDVPEQ